jgi:hypothetical protein
MDDVLYFQKKFLQCLNVPVSRLNSDALFSIGRATEITRDELKFARFIIRLRSRFSQLFLKMLEKQLVLKGIMTPDDWNVFVSDIKFDYAKDNYFTELKDAEIAQGRIQLAGAFQDFAGKYYSHDWIRRNVLQQTDVDIEEQEVQIAAENQSQDPRWMNPMIEQNAMQMQQQQAQQDGGQEASPEDQNKQEQVRQAMIFIKQMKQKGSPANRSIQDQSKYKAAVQIVAKNPDIANSLNANQGQQTQ